MSTTFKLPDNYFTTPTPPPEGVVSVFGMPGQTAIQKGTIDAATLAKQQATTMSVGPVGTVADRGGNTATISVSVNGADVVVADGGVEVGDIADDADPQLTSFNPADADEDLKVSKVEKPTAMPAAPQPPPPSTIDHETRTLALRTAGALDAAVARVAALEARIETVLSGNEALRAHIDAKLETAAAEIRSIADDFRQQLRGVDAALQAKGLPTLSAMKQPELRLVQVRPLHTPAQLQKDGTVTLYYNARTFENAAGISDQQEFTLGKGAPPRHVPVGYAVVVPAGYVCDVVVESDVVASISGAGVVEYVLPLQARAVQRTINGGSEICRLVLRKVEPCRLVIDKAKGVW